MTTISFIYPPGEGCIELLRQLEDMGFRCFRCSLDEYPHPGAAVSDIVVFPFNGQEELQVFLTKELPPDRPVLLVGKCSDAVDRLLRESDSHCPFDILSVPYSPLRLRNKMSFLQHYCSSLQGLERSSREISALEEKIGELHRSMEGHTSFLDLMAKRDGLTGLYNRHHFNAVIGEKFTTATSTGQDLCLIILNIDYFSEINKSCGQDFGDFVLNELAARITSSSTTNETCFRLSGEEFAVILDSSSVEEAMTKAEALRKLCENKPFDNGNFTRTVTVSVGVASCGAHRPRSSDAFITMADQALFLAKSEGRNRVIAYTEIDRRCFGTSEQNFKLLQDTLTKILDKTKTSTIRSLQLLSQGVMDDRETRQMQSAQLYAQLLCHKLGLTPSFIDTFRNSIILLGSIRYLLHNELISKNGKLSENDWQVLADFPYKLDQITTLFDYFSGERTILLHHGEKYDGSGYPEGLMGDQIPIGARMFTLISAIAAMSTDRPYRKKLSPEKILEELGSNAGKQFDPHLVLKLIDVIEEKGILNVQQKALDKVREKIRKILQ